MNDPNRGVTDDIRRTETEDSIRARVEAKRRDERLRREDALHLIETLKGS